MFTVITIFPPRWYQGFDWEGLINKRVSPPITPKIKNAVDASNFDSYPKDTEEPPDEMSGWDADFWSSVVTLWLNRSFYYEDFYAKCCFVATIVYWSVVPWICVLDLYLRVR